MKKLTLLLLFLCWTLSVSPQESGSKGVRLLARPAQTDSIQLRWAPVDKETWKLGNMYGYVVERYTILRDGQAIEDRERSILTDVPLKPQKLDVWQQYEDDKFVSTAAECIFGESVVPLVSPAAIARRYKEEENKFSFALYAADMSPLTAKLSGLYLVDKTAQANEKYLYIVHIPAPDSIPVDTAFAFTGLSEYFPLPKPLDLTARWTDRQVTLSWNILYLNHIYNSYIVEKSLDGENYTPISENASIQASDEGVNPEWAYRNDSLPDNQTVWYYRIRGINAFGEIGLPSDSVVGQGRLQITEAPVVTNKEIIENREVKLSWTFPEEMNEYIGGFRLYRSEKPEGTKEKIYEGTPQERTYSDNSPELTNYYVLSVYDGETEKFAMGTTYAELIDSIPPAMPTGLAGKIDSAGTAYITWNENTDKDIYGYRLFRSNHPDFEFMPVSPAEIIETAYSDTVNIKTLSKKIYYRLRAVDKRGNLSDFSEILELKIPDFIPPVSPVIKEITAEKDGILLAWYNSSSSDVVRHTIFRKSETDSAFFFIGKVVMPEIFEKTSTYKDKNVQAGETYLYRVEAEDDAGLRSMPSSPLYVKALGEKTAQQIVLKAKINNNNITLSWTIANNIARVLIYKATGQESLRVYGSSTETSFTDKEIPFGKTVKYMIKFVYNDGTNSDLSNEVILNL